MAQNLIKQLDELEVKSLQSATITQFEEDLESRKPWEEKHAKYLEVYHQQDIAANMPWDGSCTESLPLLTEACHQFQGRAYKAFFPARKFVSAVPIGTDDIKSDQYKSAERVASFVNTKLGFEDKQYKKDKNMMFLSAALHGSDFSKAYITEEGCKIRRVRAQDLVVPYLVGPVPIEEVERKTEIVFKGEYEAKRLFESGFFSKMPKVYEENDNANSEINQVVDEAQGTVKSSTSRFGQCQILEQHRFWNINGKDVPIIAHLDYTSQELLAVYPRYREEDSEFEPVEYYTHYKFFPDTDGFYGNGYGHLIGKINIGINKILRQCIDAGELANIGNMSGFVSEALGTKGGDLVLDLGKFGKIPRSVENIRNAIYQMQFPGPNASYMQLMEMLQATAQRIASTTDAVTGDVNKVLQPMTIMTMLEQSLQLPTSIMEQLSSSMEDELEKYYNCLKQSMKTSLMFSAPGESMQLMTPDDLATPMKIALIIDPRNITSQQKLAKAQALYDFGMQNPLIAQDPTAIYTMSHRVLQAMEIEEIDEILKEPPAPPEVQRIDDQEVENMYFLLPPDKRPLFDVFKDQDHLDHIQRIDGMLKKPEWASLLDPASMQELIIHRNTHMAYVYGVKEGVLQYVPDGQGGVGAVVKTGSDTAPSQGFGSGISPGTESPSMSTGQGGEVPGSMGGSQLPQAMGGGEGTLGIPSLTQNKGE